MAIELNQTAENMSLEKKIEHALLKKQENLTFN